MPQNYRQGYSVRLPLAKGSNFGYVTNTTLKQLAAQNLKCLVLTSPGERLMYPKFGVGLRKFLFYQFKPTTFKRIETRIRSQAAQYLPYVQITNVSFSPGANNLQGSIDESTRMQLDNNVLSVKITYIVALGSGSPASLTIDL